MLVFLIHCDRHPTIIDCSPKNEIMNREELFRNQFQIRSTPSDYPKMMRIDRDYCISYQLNITCDKRPWNSMSITTDI